VELFNSFFTSHYISFPSCLSFKKPLSFAYFHSDFCNNFLALKSLDFTVPIGHPTISDISGGKRIVSKTVKNTRTRAVQTEVSSTVTTADFVYAAQVGVGGIYLNNNATISGSGGATGDIMSNGPIEGESGSQITGSVIVTSEEIGEQASFTTCNTAQTVGKSSGPSDVSQSFVAAQSGSLTRVRLYVKKAGSVGDADIYITDDNSGKPSTISLATGVLDSSIVGADYAWVDVIFPSPATVASSTTYWVVFNGGSHASKYWTWCGDSAGGYTQGNAKSSSDWSSGVWSDLSHDMTFKTVVGELTSILDGVDVVGPVKANTIKNSTITGDAYYQVFENASASGDTYSGSIDPSSVPMPISSSTIANWKAEAEAGGVISGNCPSDPACSDTMGPIKIDGDLSVDVNGSVFTLEGVVYVTGDVNLNNSVTIQCSGFFDGNSCMLIADGYINADNNVDLIGSGNSSSFILLFSTKEGCLGGTQQPDCAPENSAIYTANNVNGGILYATDSLVYINNGVDIEAVVAYRFELANVASVIYKADVANLSFLADSGGGAGGDWTFNNWKEVE